MKPTSIIFIIFAAILIVIGVAVCIVGGVIANNQNVELTCDYITDAGESVIEYKPKEYKSLKTIDINVENVDINIIGQSSEAYVEFKNLNPLIYDFTISNGKLSVKTVEAFNVTRFVKIRENGIGFSGLRHFLYLNKNKGKQAQINIYLPGDAAIEKIKLCTLEADITVEKVTINCDYEVNCDKGNITFKEVTSTEKLSVVSLIDGNFISEKCSVKATDFNNGIENSNAEFILDQKNNFSVTVSEGIISFDGLENEESTFNGVYPEKVVTDDNEVTVPNTVKGVIRGRGNVVVKYRQNNTEAE